MSDCSDQCPYYPMRNRDNCPDYHLCKPDGLPNGMKESDYLEVDDENG